VAELASNDRFTRGAGNPLHRQHDAMHQVLAINFAQDVAKEIPRLRIVIVFARSVAVVPIGQRRCAGYNPAAGSGRVGLRSWCCHSRRKADLRPW
jgi:hypothetical protein